jgi:hypothetical protein
MYQEQWADVFVRKLKGLEDDRIDIDIMNAVKAEHERVSSTVFVPFIFLRHETNFTIFNDGLKLNWRILAGAKGNYLPILKGWHNNKDVDAGHLNAMMLPHPVILKLENVSGCFVPVLLTKEVDALFISVRDFIRQIEQKLDDFNKVEPVSIAGTYVGIVTPCPKSEFLFDAKLTLAAE